MSVPSCQKPNTRSPTPVLVHHRVLGGLELEVRDLERPDFVDGDRENSVDAPVGGLIADLASRLPQHAQHLRAVETLALAMFTEAHPSSIRRATIWFLHQAWIGPGGRK